MFRFETFFLVMACLLSFLTVHECALQYWTFFTQWLLPLLNLCQIPTEFPVIFLFFPPSYSLLIKCRCHLIFPLHLELDDVVRWELILVPMLYSEAPIGELRSIMVTCKYYQVPRKNVKTHNFHVRKNILKYYKIVIHILDSVYGLIYTAWAFIIPRLTPCCHLSLSRVYMYEPIYTVKNLYNL